MSNFLATVVWHRGDDDFLAAKYSRAHLWEFDGGTVVPASASPHIVPQPWSNPVNVDPEEAFVAALSSCHMLFYLSIAAQRGFLVESYRDRAVGIMARNDSGKHVISKVTLHPEVVHGGEPLPKPAEQESMHHEAHERCFIANSVTTLIEIAL